MSPIPVLIVDDDQRLAGLIRRTLEKKDILVEVCESGHSAFETLSKQAHYLVLLDLKLKDMEGTKLIEQLHQVNITPMFIMMTGQGDEHLAVDCMKLGALDYLIKDVHLLDRILPALDRAFDIIETRNKLKTAEETLNHQLQEKVILLREVHHRVKNNLSIINSLLNLQADTIASPEQAILAFDKTRDRIWSLSLIHQQLFESQDYTRVAFEDFLRDLIAHLHEQYSSATSTITILVESNGLSVHVDHAIPLGLIVNELLTNSLLYAFPIDCSGTILINLWEEEEYYYLTIRDNGIGLPDGCNDKDTLGLTLVFSLIDQINGSCVTENKDGACFTLKWLKKI
jgi:two-component sensor histidine kinase/CheY-like chemotaxis protein